MKPVRHFAFSLTIEWTVKPDIGPRPQEETGHLSCVKLHKRNARNAGHRGLRAMNCRGGKMHGPPKREIPRAIQVLKSK